MVSGRVLPLGFGYLRVPRGIEDPGARAEVRAAVRATRVALVVVVVVVLGALWAVWPASRSPFQVACGYYGSAQGSVCVSGDRVLFTRAESPFTLDALCTRRGGDVQGRVCVVGDRVVLDGRGVRR